MSVRPSKTKFLFSELWEAQVPSENKDGPVSCQGDGATTKRSLVFAKKMEPLEVVHPPPLYLA